MSGFSFNAQSRFFTLTLANSNIRIRNKDGSYYGK